MIMIPVGSPARDFALDWFAQDMTEGRLSGADARELLAQLRMAGDVANLERLSRLLAQRDRA